MKTVQAILEEQESRDVQFYDQVMESLELAGLESSDKLGYSQRTVQLKNITIVSHIKTEPYHIVLSLRATNKGGDLLYNWEGRLRLQNGLEYVQIRKETDRFVEESLLIVICALRRDKLL